MILRATLLLALIATAAEALAQDNRPSAPPEPAPYLRDRGTGLSTSMFGTYIRHGEWLFYPFFEYYRDTNLEYAPSELGAAGDQDYRGRYHAREGLFFVSYGLTDNLAVEFEMAGISATFDKSPFDTSTLPSRLTESGLGDVEGQLRWRWRQETDRRPEWFSYGEVVVPHHSSRPLTGTADWEVKVGTGVTRGLRWGTLTARAALEYDAGSTSPFDVGEYAVEYLRRLSRAWRVYAGIEGNADELELIAEAQWHLSPHVFLRMNNGFGLTSKATDWAPEIGVVVAVGR